MACRSRRGRPPAARRRAPPSHDHQAGVAGLAQEARAWRGRRPAARRSPRGRRRWSRPRRRTPRSGTPAARRRCRAARRASARTTARPGSRERGRRGRAQGARLQARVEQRRERAERRQAERRLALRGGRDEQREAGVEPVERARGEDDGDHAVQDRMDTTLDARGLACPLPAVKARARAAPTSPPGGALVVLATDPEAPIDLAAVAADAGCTVAVERGRRRLARDAQSPSTASALRRSSTTWASPRPAARRRARCRRSASPPRARPPRPGRSPRSPRSPPARARSPRRRRGTCRAPACRARPRRPPRSPRTRRSGPRGRASDPAARAATRTRRRRSRRAPRRSRTRLQRVVERLEPRRRSVRTASPSRSPRTPHAVASPWIRSAKNACTRA